MKENWLDDKEGMTRRSDPIQVAFCSDPGYIRQLAAALVSLFLSNWKNELVVYVVTTGLDPRFKEGLQKIATTYGRELIFLDINDESFDNLAAYVQPKSAYYRLMLPDLLKSIDKAIYLDSDLVVEIDLRELWEIPLWSELLLGVAERDELQPKLQAHVGTPGDRYINSGVLVMNLERWRAESVTDQCLAWLRENPLRATMMDQDAINKIAARRKGYIDLKWNLNPIHGPARETLPKFPERILHFAGLMKPWHEWYCHDLADIFYGYLKKAGPIFSLEKIPPTKFGQYLSTANQLWERQKIKPAAVNYIHAINLAISFRKEISGIESYCIELARVEIQHENHRKVCEHLRMLLKHWGYPDAHTDIYTIPEIR
jgi:lipopolysaccharide biosynthesis glycosyltransferase